ncbi:MAG: hypothetical protein ABEL76_08585, partial [Bradymonadaceae bacterium]
MTRRVRQFGGGRRWGWDVLSVIVVCIGLAACGPRGKSGDETFYKPYTPPDAGGSRCGPPDLNGRLTGDEMRVAVGVPARFLVSPPGETRRVDLRGGRGETGRRWDWSRRREDDRNLTVTAEPLDEKWYADQFPRGEFTLPVDLGEQADGIYRKTSAALELLGLASADESAPTTLLKYQPPVDIYRFPVRPGRNWVSVGRVEDGKLKGQPWAT